VRSRLARSICIGALLALAGCKPSESVACMPPDHPTCPAVAPSFADQVYPDVFLPFCVSCHSPTGVEPGTPLTSYQQIRGPAGVEATEIFTQVFESCLMPPSNAPAQLTDDEGGDALGSRQILLDWLACGAPDN
jgi:hypothetical protein